MLNLGGVVFNGIVGVASVSQGIMFEALNKKAECPQMTFYNIDQSETFETNAKISDFFQNIVQIHPPEFNAEINRESKDQKAEHFVIPSINLETVHIRQLEFEVGNSCRKSKEINQSFLKVPKLDLSNANVMATLFEDPQEAKALYESESKTPGSRTPGSRTPGSKKVKQIAQQTLKQIKKTAVKCLPKDLKAGEIRELGNEFQKNGIFVIKLGDRYSFIKIGKKIGHGAFSVVYQIEETAGNVIEQYGDLVVKKLIVTNDTGEIDNEMSAAELKLPHVVLTYAAYKFHANGKNHLILLQQSLKGGEIEKLLLSENTSIDIKIEAIRQFALGEKELQDNHIFHRDIKPGNAMLLNDVSGSDSKISDVDVRVIDFGNYINMAKHKNPKESLTWKGTIGYAAPELIAIQLYRLASGTIGNRNSTLMGIEMARKMLYSNGKVDKRKIENFHQACEVYALSVTAFEVLFGVLPKMALKVRECSMDEALGFAGLIETRDSNYTEEDRQRLYQEAEEKGIPLDLMELIWRGFGPDPTERPSMNDFATYGL
ncbi:MAG: protein kinase [Parachlamydiaceae bacterium]|nr:protein kinase [Parachlamydiaceae bacterium]